MTSFLSGTCGCLCLGTPASRTGFEWSSDNAAVSCLPWPVPPPFQSGVGPAGLGLASVVETAALRVHVCAFVRARGFSPVACRRGGGRGGLSHPPVSPLPRLEWLSVGSHPEFTGDRRAYSGMVGAWLVLGGRSSQDANPRPGQTGRMNGWTAGESRGSFPVV